MCLRSKLFSFCSFFFFNDTATTEIYTLSLHDALPISTTLTGRSFSSGTVFGLAFSRTSYSKGPIFAVPEGKIRFCLPERQRWRSEEHTSELQSHLNLVCRLLLEKKKI